MTENVKLPFYVDVVQDGGDIICWYRDYDKSLQKEVVKTSDYTYGYVLSRNQNTDTGMKDIFGRTVKRVSFDRRRDMDEYKERHGDVTHEMDVSALTRFMIDEFSYADIDSPVNVGYYDIEVEYNLEDGNGFPLPSNPFGEISCIQLFDVSKNQYVMFIPYEYRDRVTLEDDLEIEIFWCVDERDMLRTFAEYIDHIDILAGWYTNGFDLPYIMERAIMLFDKVKAQTMFCRDGYPAERRDFIDDNGVPKWEWTLKGRQHVDMLELFKKFIPGERDSYSLDSVCEEYLGEKKVEYVGDLGRLQDSDPQTYYTYALHDVRLLKNLDKKLDIIARAVTMSREACVHLRDVSSTVKPIENSFIKFCHAKGVVLPNKKTHSKEKYPGAIVYDTRSGLFKWAASYDLTSLYPSTMIMLGLSTETLVAQCKNGFEDFVEIVQQTKNEVTLYIEETGEKITAAACDVWDMIKEEGFTISANGTIFNGELGLLSEFVLSIFDKRVSQKNLSKDFYKSGDKTNGDKFDLYQKVTKIFANSLYGCIANIHFRLFDIRLAASITLTGQMISKNQAVAAEQILTQWEL